MNYSYAEAGVKRKETVGTYAIRVLMIFAAIIALLISTFNTIALIAGTAIIIAIVIFFPRLKVDYEYVFVDGQLDFDKIMGGAKRKTALRIDFEQVTIMAPMGSHALDAHNNPSYKVKDFSSRNKDVKPYVIVYRKGEDAYKILFEPSKKMIEAIKSKNPRKVSEY